ncbi:MAG: CBS domain-containing protein [Peptococcaceae bacterium]|mgnify:FL=1|nr:CBS domain-containing protein [Peptococcaceae bacterium]
MALAYEIMVDQVISVSEHDSVKTALKVLCEHHISGIPVVNSQNEPVGYISDGDIMKYIGYRDPSVFFFDLAIYPTSWIMNQSFEEKINDLQNFNVMDIATSKVITVQYDEEIEKIAKVLGAKKIKQVPVVKDKKLVGIISRGDIVRYIVKNFLD